jgi:hypothetical protein
MWTGKADQNEPIQARRIKKNRGPLKCDFDTVGSMGLPFSPEDGSNMLLRNVGNIYETTGHYIPGDRLLNLQIHSRENFRSHRAKFRLNFK